MPIPAIRTVPTEQTCLAAVPCLFPVLEKKKETFDAISYLVFAGRELQL